jgi:hypothetical protein
MFSKTNYFVYCRIPDCPTEPEADNIPVTEPAIIPQEDLTGNPDSVKDFSHLPWAEPKGMQPALPVATGGGWRVSLYFFLLILWALVKRRTLSWC